LIQGQLRAMVRNVRMRVSGSPTHACTSTDQLLWVAGYDDGTQLEECDGNADHGFGEVDLERLRYFALVPRSGGGVQHVVQQSKGTKLIFFRRRQIELSQDLDGAQEWVTIPVLGLKITAGDRVTKVYEYLLPNGSTLLTDDFAAL
jgi:hypothetical protein